MVFKPQIKSKSKTKMIKFLISFLAIVFFVQAQEHLHKDRLLEPFLNQPKQLFKQYHSLFQKDKEYDINSKTGVLKYKIFKANVEIMQRLNNEYGKKMYGFTPYVDMTQSEFSAKYLMSPEFLERGDIEAGIYGKVKSSSSDLSSEFLKETPKVELLDEYAKFFNDDSNDNNNLEDEKSVSNPQYIVDYKNFFNRVKDQNPCGSCWAFAACGLIEATYNMKFGKLLNLSEQYLLDCDYTNGGCRGGHPRNVLAFAIKYGVQSTSQRPYTGQQNYCSLQQEASKTMKIVKSFKESTFGDFNSWYGMLMKGPIYVAMDGENPYLHMFKPASLDYSIDCNRCVRDNHVIIVTGLYSIGSQKKLVVRNSWGENWGFNGYFSADLNGANDACFLKKFAFTVEVQQDTNQNNDDWKNDIIDDDDSKNDNTNQTCQENFYTDCNFSKPMKPKHCDYFTDASVHFGARIQGIKNSDYNRTWVFYNQKHCAGQRIEFNYRSEKEMCFNWFAQANLTNVLSGHMIDIADVINYDVIRISSDFCFGGETAIVSGMYAQNPPLKFVPKSIAFSKYQVSPQVTTGIVIYDQPNFQGNVCFLNIKNGYYQANVSCNISKIGSLYTVKGQIN